MNLYTFNLDAHTFLLTEVTCYDMAVRKEIRMF